MPFKEELIRLLNDPEIQKIIYRAVETEKQRQEQRTNFYKANL